MQGATALLEQAAVRYLVGERVLERILQLREQAGLVQEFGCLECRHPAAEVFVIRISDSTQKGVRHILADHGGRLE